MPSLGADMEAGTLVEWRVAPGDAVRRGDIVAVVDTDKAVIEVEIWEDGVIDELLVEPGRKVPVGTPLARLRAAAKAGRPAAPEAAAPAAQDARAAPGEPAAASPAAPVAASPAPTRIRDEEAPPAAAPTAPGRVRATPLARRVAGELGLALADVHGSGPGGAITRADVETAAHAPAPASPGAPAREESAASPAPSVAAPDRAAGLRRAIAAAMARAKREIPHYYLGTTIDLSRALAWLAAENARRPIAERLLPAALLLRAVALAARDVPEMNGFFDDGFRPAPAVHLGVAISLRGGGLVAPALHDADRKSLDALMHELSELVARTRRGVLRSSDLSDATLTVTNLGEQGVESVFGVIYPPQVAIVGFGRIGERPWAQDGLLGVRPVVSASLAADHRASDGLRGARFLAAIDRHLQEPGKP
jgi:pyruvate dehydrogenase E2 component (dihydrolipoamide acetyltransferase)